MKKYDIAIIGAGIVGLTSAYYTLEAGFKTALIDLSIPGRGGSYNSAGIVTRQLFTSREIELAIESIRILYEVIPDLDKYVYGREFITIEFEDEAFQDFRFYRKHMGDVKIYYSDEIDDKWPHIKLSDDEAIVYTSKDLMIDPRGVLNSLYSQIKTEDRLLSLIYKEASQIIEGRPYKIEFEDGGYIEADSIVLAMGAWNKEFLGYHRIYVPVHTYVCFSLLIEIPIDIMISGSDEVYYSYWMKIDEKTVVAGEYYQSTPIATPDEIPNVNTRGKVQSLRRTLKERFRGINRIKLKEMIIGPCSYSTSRKPIQKEVMKNVYLINGLGGYGYTLGPALAKRVINRIINSSL